MRNFVEMSTYGSNASSKKEKEPKTEYESYMDQYNAHIANKPATWNGGTYAQSLSDALNRIQNREPFKYDLNGDALYQQYKDQYMLQGKLAMLDTTAQASAMTGGYGNSYAATAGNQAYQNSLAQLNNVVPELYQLAYDKYNNETNDLYNQYSLVNDQYDREYNESRNALSDWQTEGNRLYGLATDAYEKEQAKASAGSGTTTTTNTSTNPVNVAYTDNVKEFIAAMENVPVNYHDNKKSQDKDAFIEHKIEELLMAGKITKSEAAALVTHYGFE